MRETLSATYGPLLPTGAKSALLEPVTKPTTNGTSRTRARTHAMS
jgi:hypothetical protein